MLFMEDVPKKKSGKYLHLSQIASSVAQDYNTDGLETIIQIGVVSHVGVNTKQCTWAELAVRATIEAPIYIPFAGQ